LARTSIRCHPIGDRIKTALTEKGRERGRGGRSQFTAARTDTDEPEKEEGLKPHILENGGGLDQINPSGGVAQIKLGKSTIEK